jgi:hypothetical protein
MPPLKLTVATPSPVNKPTRTSKGLRIQLSCIQTEEEHLHERLFEIQKETRELERRKNVLWRQRLGVYNMLSTLSHQPKTDGCQLLTMPAEILHQIFAHFTVYPASRSQCYAIDEDEDDPSSDPDWRIDRWRRRDVKSLRLVCRKIRDHVTPYLYPVLSIEFEPKYFDKRLALLRNPAIASGVHAIRFNLRYLSERLAERLDLFKARFQEEIELMLRDFRQHIIILTCQDAQEKEKEWHGLKDWRLRLAEGGVKALCQSWGALVDNEERGKCPLDGYQQMLLEHYESYVTKYNQQAYLRAEGYVEATLAPLIAKTQHPIALMFVDEKLNTDELRKSDFGSQDYDWFCRKCKLRRISLASEPWHVCETVGEPGFYKTDEDEGSDTSATSSLTSIFYDDEDYAPDDVLFPPPGRPPRTRALRARAPFVVAQHLTTESDSDDDSVEDIPSRPRPMGDDSTGVPVHLLTSFPIALQKAGVRIRKLKVLCFPLVRQFSAILPPNFEEHGWRDFAAACGDLESFAFSTSKDVSDNVSMGEFDLAPEEHEALQDFLGAALVSRKLTDIELAPASFAEYRHPDRRGSPRRDLGLFLRAADWPEVSRIHIKHISLSADVMRHLLQTALGPKVSHLRLEATLQDGKWAPLLDLMREQLQTGRDPARLCTISLDLRGAEISRLWSRHYPPHVPRNWAKFWPQLQKKINSYVAGVDGLAGEEHPFAKFNVD